MLTAAGCSTRLSGAVEEYFERFHFNLRKHENNEVLNAS